MLLRGWGYSYAGDLVALAADDVEAEIVEHEALPDIGDHL